MEASGVAQGSLPVRRATFLTLAQEVIETAI